MKTIAVITVDHDITDAQAARITTQFDRLQPKLFDEVVVLEKGMILQVVQVPSSTDRELEKWVEEHTIGKNRETR